MKVLYMLEFAEPVPVCVISGERVERYATRLTLGFGNSRVVISGERVESYPP